MGKTPAKKRLMIWVDEEYLHHPKIEALKEKGHEIIGIGAWAQAPMLILSKHAFRMLPRMLETKGLLELSIKAARLRKEGKPDEEIDDVETDRATS